MFGSIVRKKDVHTIDNIAPRQHRSSDTCIGNSTDTCVSDNNNIITNNINKLSTRKRTSPALDLANIRVDTIPTRKSSRISSLNGEKDIANKTLLTHLASAVSIDNLFVMPALEQIQAAIVDDTEQGAVSTSFFSEAMLGLVQDSMFFPHSFDSVDGDAHPQLPQYLN